MPISQAYSLSLPNVVKPSYVLILTQSLNTVGSWQGWFMGDVVYDRVAIIVVLPQCKWVSILPVCCRWYWFIVHFHCELSLEHFSRLKLMTWSPLFAPVNKITFVFSGDKCLELSETTGQLRVCVSGCSKTQTNWVAVFMKIYWQLVGPVLLSSAGVLQGDFSVHSRNIHKLLRPQMDGHTDPD